MYGALNVIASFNDPTASATVRRTMIESIIVKYAQIPHWKNENEMALIAHDLWLLQEPDYYAKTRIHGRALFPVRSSIESGIDEIPKRIVEMTKRVWSHAYPHLWEIAPGGSHSPPSDALQLECIRRISSAINVHDSAEEVAQVRLSEPVRPKINDPLIGVPPIGEEPVISSIMSRSRPSDPVYEDLLSFLAPLHTIGSPSQARDHRMTVRGSTLPGRRIFVKEVLRWFVTQQCKFELTAIHYAYLVHCGLLPNPVSNLPNAHPQATRRRPIWSYTDDSDRSNRSVPFRAIEGYEAYNSVLDVHMRVFADKCFPFVLDPIVNLLTDAAWLETFPLTLEEVTFMIVMTIDETYHNKYYQELLPTVEEQHQQSIKDRIEKQFMNLLGELSILVQYHRVIVPDEVIIEAWNMWDQFNNIDIAHANAMTKLAYRSAMDLLKHIRRVLPGARADTAINLSSMNVQLEGLRSTVIARWRAWTRGYAPFRNVRVTVNHVHGTLNRLQSVDDPNTPLNFPPRIDQYATAFCNEFASKITCDGTGVMFTAFSAGRTGYNPFSIDAMIRPLERFSRWWEKTIPLSSAIASAIQHFRNFVLDYVYYSTYMNAALGRVQTVRTLPYSYAPDYTDELEDLATARELRYRMMRSSAVHVINGDDPGAHINNPFRIMVSGLPWNRQWTGNMQRRWSLRPGRTEHIEDTNETSLIRRIHVPDRWIMKHFHPKANANALVDYKWIIDCKFQYSPPGADSDFAVQYQFVIDGSIPVNIVSIGRGSGSGPECPPIPDLSIHH